MIQILIDQYVCVNKNCMQENIIHNGDQDPID